ncbi:MAG: hypothetical protein KAW12_02465 [Candidatus Aminicenantes bacterium]|nr:hypothetical protein [Candidatus Aminicenantes bacterium]
MAQLPYLETPYVAELSFFKKIENVGGELEKEKFADERIKSPFFFLLEIRELENSGELAVSFYDKEGKRVKRKVFSFGEDGQYYEYILFFDSVAGLTAGKYRYTIFLNDRLIYGAFFDITE